MSVADGVAANSRTDVLDEVQRGNNVVNSGTKVQKALGSNGSLDLPGKIENLKAWSTTAMKCTKQAIEEKLGTTSPTRDPEIESKIEEIKRMQVKYQEMSSSVKKMIGHLNALATLEQAFSSQLTMAAQQQPELHSEFAHNAEAQRVSSASISSYIESLELFCDGIETFCKRTVPDTLATIRHLEHARLVYDTYRNELERMENKAARAASTSQQTDPGVETVVADNVAASSPSPEASTPPPPTPTATSNPPAPQLHLSVQQLRQKFTAGKENYLALKADTDVKMKLLHENRVRVLRNHLGALQKATLSFYAKGCRGLESSLDALSQRDVLANQFVQNQPAPSFLETESPAADQKTAYFNLENGDVDRDVFQE